MRKSPQEITMLLADSMKRIRQGESITISEIKKITGLHYETIQSYAEMAVYIQRSFPRIELIDEGSLGIRIIEVPSLNFSIEDEFILFLFDNQAFRSGSASNWPKWFSAEDLTETKALVVVTGDQSRCYLTPDGIIKAVELADQRESAIIDPISTMHNEPVQNAIEKPMLSLNRNFIVRFMNDYTNFARCGLANLGDSSSTEMSKKKMEDVARQTGTSQRYDCIAEAI